jgi:hypothetical protein
LARKRSIALESGVGTLVTGGVDYSSIKNGLQVTIGDPTQIVFVGDLVQDATSP